MLEEKKTFKGYIKIKWKVEDYIKLEAGVTLTKSKIYKPWLKSFKDGVNHRKTDNSTLLLRLKGQLTP